MTYICNVYIYILDIIYWNMYWNHPVLKVNHSWAMMNHGDYLAATIGTMADQPGKHSRRSTSRALAGYLRCAVLQWWLVITIVCFSMKMAPWQPIEWVAENEFGHEWMRWLICYLQILWPDLVSFPMMKNCHFPGTFAKGRSFILANGGSKVCTSIGVRDA